MKIHFYLAIATAFLLVSFSCGNVASSADDDTSDSIPQSSTQQDTGDSIVKIEMFLSAFGVESDFPSIDVFIDLTNDSSHCTKSFYNPAIQGSTYSLTSSEMQALRDSLKIDDLKKLNASYSTNRTDQPRSTTTIYTTSQVFSFDDYGLVAPYPLKRLYDIAYHY